MVDRKENLKFYLGVKVLRLTSTLYSEQIEVLFCCW